MTAPDDRTQQAFAALADVQRRITDLLGSSRGAIHLPGSELIQSLVAGLRADQERFAALQAAHYQEQLSLWARHFGAAPAAAEPQTHAPPVADRRFAAREWQEQPWFAWLKESYLARARWIESLVDLARADARTHRKLRFLARQFIDAAAPSNYIATNPEAIRLALQSRGESLQRGTANLHADLARGRISMTDESAFEVGRNLAVTPGAVVYENALMQVLQYAPLTATVRERPLVIVPPCINKFYVLDLQPHNSFVRYAVESGLTVFMISWRNMPPELGTIGWDAYLQDGVVRAIQVARSITGAAKVNALGFCVGGTMLASALAVLRRKRRMPAASLTLLATLLDFSEPGEIGVYVDDAYVQRAEAEFREGGVLPGGQLATTFASLRANELVWRYVVDHYLKGGKPEAFDLLYWNSDGANLPGAMYTYYLRQMYLENSLCKPDRLTMCSVPVDLGRIRLPAYVLATREDHIVPWASAYAGARLLGEQVRFVLGASGHIAGVVNPAAKDRRSYRLGPPPACGPDAWLDASTEHRGSWWKDWLAWIMRRCGRSVPARQALGGATHFPIEPAPGRYVRERI